MDEAEIQQRINNTPKRQRRYIQPFANAGQRLQEWLVNDEGRFMLGLREVDAMIRGIGPGELAYVIGRPHSGKTQVVLNALANNPDKPNLVREKEITLGPHPGREYVLKYSTGKLKGLEHTRLYFVRNRLYQLTANRDSNVLRFFDSFTLRDTN